MGDGACTAASSLTVRVTIGAFLPDGWGYHWYAGHRQPDISVVIQRDLGLAIVGLPGVGSQENC